MSIANFTVKDSSGTTKNLSVVDVSGNGSGPFLPIHTISDSAGSVISGSNPLSTSEPAVQGVTNISVPGRGCILIITTAGNVDFTFTDTSTLTNVPVSVGLNIFPFSVTNVVASASGGAVIGAAKGAK